MSIKLEAGQWYRTRGGSLVRCVDGGIRYVGSFVFEAHNSAYYVLSDGRHVCGNSNWDIVEHLPDCTGFDWEPPKPEPKYRPFKNAEEAFPHCDEWLVNDSNHKLRVNKVNKSGIATYDGYFDFEHAFFKYKKLDGTPFGVRVDG